MLGIGIDPGLSGAMALLCPVRGLLDVEDLPTCANGLESGRMVRWLDVRSIAETLHRWSDAHELGKESVAVFLERPIAMPGQQISTAASNFDCQGVLRALMTIRGYTTRMVPPAEWKRYYKLGKDKDAAVKTARALYPTAPLTLAKHHNRSEAILIGRYGLRMLT